MAKIEKTALFPKLSRQAYQALEDSAMACRQRGNKNVELAHWIDQLLRHGDYDVACAARAFKLQPEALIFDVKNAIEALPRTNVAVPAFSPQIFEALQEALLWSA